jgi:hypothetical protein
MDTVDTGFGSPLVIGLLIAAVCLVVYVSRRGSGD